MTLRTNPADRREVVQAISEQLGSPAIYLRTPTCAYRIGDLTVERDGSIASDDGALLDGLRPMLMERGWLTETADSGAEAPPAETEPDGPDSEPMGMELSFPVEDWTVPQLTNLLRILYSHQHILRRMMRSDALCIDRQLVERLEEAQTLDDLEARLADGVAAEMLKGCRIQNGKFTFEATLDDSDPTLWQVYGTLLGAMLRHAKAAKRVFLKEDADSENEKYRANSLLTRLGFGGPEHKELRRVLMGHLSGYAAFKNEAGMRAHREKYAQLRREQQAAKEGTET